LLSNFSASSRVPGHHQPPTWIKVPDAPIGCEHHSITNYNVNAPFYCAALDGDEPQLMRRGTSSPLRDQGPIDGDGHPRVVRKATPGGSCTARSALWQRRTLSGATSCMGDRNLDFAETFLAPHLVPRKRLAHEIGIRSSGPRIARLLRIAEPWFRNSGRCAPFLPTIPDDAHFCAPPSKQRSMQEKPQREPHEQPQR
jgi:hypothetical protein